MYQISLNNIDLIRSDISRQRVSYSHLLDDLIDHVCCDIENEMNKGLSFEMAYSNVKKKIGLNRYKKIQEETLLLTNKKYRNMKNFIKIFGALSPTLIALAALFKIQHWPGASIMLTLGFFFLCFLFIPAAVYVLYTENKSSKKHLLMYVSGLFSSIIILLGFLFKVMHWPGASILLTVGLVLGALVFLPSLVFSKISDDKGEGKKTAYLIGLFAGFFYIAGFLFKMMHWPGASVSILISMILAVAVFIPAYSYAHFKNEQYVKGKFILFISTIMMAVMSLSLMSLKVSQNIFEEFIVADNQMDQVLNELSQKNDKLTKYLTAEYSSNEKASEVHKRTGEMEAWITNLKKELIITSRPENSAAIKGDKIDCSEIITKDDMNTPMEVLIGIEKNGKAYELADKLKDYKAFLLSTSEDPGLTTSLGALLNVTEETKINDYTYTWEELNFKHRTLMSVINTLTAIQIKVSLAEKEILKSISKTEGESALNMLASELITK